MAVAERGVACIITKGPKPSATRTYDPWGGARLDDAVKEQERQGGSAVADCEGIRSDDGSGDRSEVVCRVRSALLSEEACPVYVSIAVP